MDGLIFVVHTKNFRVTSSLNLLFRDPLSSSLHSSMTTMSDFFLFFSKLPRFEPLTDLYRVIREIDACGRCNDDFNSIRHPSTRFAPFNDSPHFLAAVS